MESILIISAISLVGYILYTTFKQEKSREVELNFYLMQAKNILSKNDIQDRRKWFINRFQEAENHIISAQSVCTKPIEYDSVADVKKELTIIKKKYSN